MRPSILEYLVWLFQPFFRWWWAAVSGTASIVALWGTPQSGVTLPSTIAAIMVLAIFVLFFLVLSVLEQGWSLYWDRRDRNRSLEVVSISRAKDKDFDADLVFVISGYLQESIGTLVEIRRLLEDIEVTFAIVRVVRTTEKGYYLAVPIWISPGHQKDFMDHEFAPRTLRAKTTLTYDRVWEAFNERAE